MADRCLRRRVRIVGGGVERAPGDGVYSEHREVVAGDESAAGMFDLVS